MTLDPAIGWTVVLVLAGVFGAAAVSKLRALDAFVGVVHNFRLVPEPLERPIAYVLPGIELAIAVGVLVSATRATAALAAAILLALFAGAMAINLLRGRRDIDCGCFATVLRQHLSWPLVLRNLLLAGLALSLVPGFTARSLGWLDLVTVGGASAALVVLYAATSWLFGVATPSRPARG
jgi:Methylamine utilisation protein MauE